MSQTSREGTIFQKPTLTPDPASLVLKINTPDGKDGRTPKNGGR